MQIILSRIPILCLFLAISLSLSAQSVPEDRFFHPADTFDKGRFWTGIGIASGIYTGSMIGLNQVWYADYERNGFHFFNDNGEWKNMDKIGHLYSAYFESYIAYKGFRWAGCKPNRSVWGGVIVGSLLQASIEVLDGFSEKWGFSVPDIAYNTAGVALMAGQEWLWQDQRILMKLSSQPVNYPEAFAYSEDGLQTYSIKQRAHELYGAYPTAFFKDYNAMTLWASVNVAAFLPESSRWPKWLNMAAGYSAENIYGGFENNWEVDGQTFIVDSQQYPRFGQFYLSPDVDWNRIKTDSPLWKVVFTVLNLVKVPAPALEINGRGKLRLHPLRF